MLDAGSNIVDEYDKEYRSKDRTLWNPTDDCGYKRVYPIDSYSLWMYTKTPNDIIVLHVV